MPSKTFTDMWVANIKLKPGERQQVYFDTKERLVLVVGTKAKTWRLLTYVAGKAKTRKLGRYPDLSLKDARQKARDYHDDPLKFAEQSNPDHYKQVAENWVRRHVDENKLRSKPEIERILTKYIYPKWADRKFLDIRRGEINQLLDFVADHHGPSQADSALKVIRSISNFYAARNEHYVSPIVRGMKRSKQSDRKQLRFLNDDEIRAVWAACAQLGTFGRLVKVALLLGQRRGKLGSNDAAMKWADISDGVWTINVEEREKGTASQIKLPQLVQDILNEQPPIAGNPYVFPASTGGPFNAFSNGMTALRDVLPYDMPNWSMHDLRRTTRKLMTRAAVRPDVAELAIGHSIKGIQQIYDDPREYHSMTDHAFECVAAEIEKVLNPQPSNVIPLRHQ
jgi:integrase